MFWHTRSSEERAQDAHDKGQEDYAKCGGLPHPNPITEAFHPSYAPPKGNEEEYEGGWNNAKKQDRS